MLRDSRSSNTVGRPLEVLAAATRLGLTSFGGPIAHLGYFRDEYRRPAEVGRRADIRRPGGPLSVPAGAREQPGGHCPRDLPRGPARRARRMARVHAAVGDRADCLRHRRSGFRSLGGRVASRPEGRGGGRRCAGRLGNGPGAVPGSRARDDGPCRRHGRLRVADRVGTGAGDHPGRRCRPAAPSPIGRARCSTHQQSPSGAHWASPPWPCSLRSSSSLPAAPLPHAVPSARGLR